MDTLNLAPLGKDIDLTWREILIAVARQLKASGGTISTQSPKMGRYNFAPQRVHQAATRLLDLKRISPPPWYDVIANMPPSERLVRPALQRSQKKGKRPSRMFQPIQIKYPEDDLRQEFFGDHPWELARPRIILEDDGRDHERFDWSQIEQPGKQLDGER